ncbi:MAG TPA: GNAT family N-acetyltransferase [Trueperaceae bacterium]
MRGTDPLDFAVVRTHLRHADGIYDVIRLANGYPTDRYCHCINQEAVAEQLERFPEGQFVAVTYEDGRERVVGMASTMLTARTPDDEPLAWYDMVGSFGLRNHDPDGDWLYGVEIAVHPDYQRHGIGTALYRARLALIDELGLEGWYAGGMLMGYHRYRGLLTPREYGQRVIAGEIEDPTVSMQLRRGFEPRAIVENYYPEWKAGHAAVLLVYQPPRARAARRPRGARPGVGQEGAVSALPVRRAGHSGHTTGHHH